MTHADAVRLIIFADASTVILGWIFIILSIHICHHWGDD